MKKILFLPLFTVQSGHHQTADALMDAFQELNPSVTCEKVDLLSETSPFFEKFLSQLYVSWISKMPGLYSKAYKKWFASCPFYVRKVFEQLYLSSMERLYNNHLPDLIVCTHGFPSLLASKLRARGIIQCPIVNVYTDFFVNGLWGMTGVDYHFIPTKEVRGQLLAARAARPSQLILSGILTHDELMQYKGQKHSRNKLNLLVAGGSLGIGENMKLFHTGKRDPHVHYKVLCGQNEEMRAEIESLNDPSIEALPYVESRQEMAELYAWADGMVTKAGGITVSEAMKQKLPLFIHSALPGQEEINVSYLKKHGLAYILNPLQAFEPQIIAQLKNEPQMRKYQKNLQEHTADFEIRSCREAADFLLSIIQAKSKETGRKRKQNRFRKSRWLRSEHVIVNKEAAAGKNKNMKPGKIMQKS